MIDTVIFDLDGTLLNTLEDLADSTNYALSCFGLPQRSLDEIRRFVGNGVELLIKRAVDGELESEEEARCLALFKEYYSVNMDNKTRPYDGILNVVKDLQNKNYKIAIVSNKFDSAVKILNEQYFDGIFPVAIGASESVRKKPEPDSVYEALKCLESDKISAVYIGDSEVDVMTAKNAGIPCIGVLWGFRDEAVLKSQGADYIISKPEEILELLNGRPIDC